MQRRGPTANGDISRPGSAGTQGSTAGYRGSEDGRSVQSSETSSSLRTSGTGSSAPSPTRPRAALALPHIELEDALKDSPFLDLSSPMTTYEWLKMAVMLPVLLVRLALTVVLMPLVWLLVWLLILGVRPNEPVPAWRAAILRAWLRAWGTVLLGVGMNFWAPQVVGRENYQKARDARAIIVFNHHSYMDAIILITIFACSGVAKAGVANIPFFGTFATALQFLFFSRRGTRDIDNAHTITGSTTDVIAQRAADPRFPLLMVAPEGTTKAGHVLLKFSTGAFVSGQPVLPVLMHYHHKHFNCGWGITQVKWHLLRLLCQFVNHVKVEILEPYFPSEAEKQDPSLYANNVRQLMAERLGAQLSDHSMQHNMTLKKNGITVDWQGKRILKDPSKALKLT